MTDDNALDPPLKKKYRPRAVQPIDRAIGAVSYEDERRAAVHAVQAALTPRRKPTVDIGGAIECVDRDGRVAYCAQLLAQGAWRTAHTRELALAWGISAYRVNSLVTEASRQVAAAIGGRDRVRMTTLTFLETLAHDAARDGDRRTAVAAVRAIADIAGLVSRSVEHSGTVDVAVTQVKQLSNEELDRAILQLGAERAKKLATDERRELTDVEAAIVQTERLLGDGMTNDETPDTE